MLKSLFNALIMKKIKNPYLKNYLILKKINNSQK